MKAIQKFHPTYIESRTIWKHIMGIMRRDNFVCQTLRWCKSLVQISSTKWFYDIIFIVLFIIKSLLKHICITCWLYIAYLELHSCSISCKSYLTYKVGWTNILISLKFHVSFQRKMHIGIGLLRRDCGPPCFFFGAD